MRRFRIFCALSRRVLMGIALAGAVSGCANQSGGRGQPADGSFAVPPLAAAPDPVPTPLPGDPLGATVHRLANGLTVYISTDRAKPRIATWLVIKSGSRHDPARSTGLAHYLEHMLFNGTPELGTLDGAAEKKHLDRIEALYAKLFAEKDATARQALLAQIDQENQATKPYVIPNEFDRLYSTLGFQGRNAFTSDDLTVYVVDLPSNRFEHWARIDSNRMLRPTFRLFTSQLEVVYEEKNQSLDSPEERANETMNRLLYPQHPYGTQTTIGTSEHLKNPAFEDMVAYYKRWYVPNNAAIVLAGDIDAPTALPIIEKHFGSWAPKPLTPPEPGALPPLRGRAFSEIRAEGEESVQLAWPTVPSGHPDELALELADMLLDNARSGLITTELVLPQKVGGAGSFPRFSREAGTQWLWATAKDGQPLEELEHLLLGVLTKLKQGAFTQEELDATLLSYEISEKRRLESNGARVNLMANSFVFGERWADTVARPARRARIGRAEVIAAVNRHLGSDFAVVYRRKGKFEPPKIAKPKITPIEPDLSRKSRFAREIEAMPVKEVEPQVLKEGRDFARGRLPAGPLIAVRNTRNDLFTITYRFETGMRRQPLLCHALTLFKKSGTGQLDAAALQKKLFALGATVDGGCSLDNVSVHVEGIDAKMKETLTLVESWLRQPRFEAADVSKLADVTLTDRRNSVEDPRSANQALVAYAGHGPRSFFLLQPSNEAIRRASGDDLRPLVSALPDLQHRTFYYGPRSAADAAREIGLGRNHKPVPPREPERYRRATRDVILHLPREMAQAQVTIFFPGAPMKRKDWAMSELLGEYLGGASSLLFHDIRESRGLAYGANAAHQLGDRLQDDTLLAAQLATQPDKTSEAIARVYELLRKVPLDKHRLDETKAAVAQRLRSDWIHPRSVAGSVHFWEEHGVMADPRIELRAEVAALQPAAVERALRAMVSVPSTVALTGKGKELDLESLRGSGKNAVVSSIEEITADKLFSYGPFPAALAAPQAALGSGGR